MDGFRFDRLTRRLVQGRTSRRAALVSGAGAFTALLASISQRGTLAWQAATLEASPVTSQRVEMLFVQGFDSGTMVPDPVTQGALILTLEQVSLTTVYFSDRPQRLTGTVQTEHFVDNRVFSPDNPPNAALVTDTAQGRDTIIIELRSPRYNTATRTATYRVQPIGEYRQEGLDSLARQQTDANFSEAFGAGSLFIDDVSCLPDGSIAYSCADCCSYPYCAESGNSGVYECSPTGGP